MILILTMIKSQLVKCHISPSLSDRMRWTVKCQQARASGHLISHRFSYNQMSGKTAPHTPLTYQPLCVSLTHSTMTVFFSFSVLLGVSVCLYASLWSRMKLCMGHVNTPIGGMLGQCWLSSDWGNMDNEGMSVMQCINLTPHFLPLAYSAWVLGDKVKDRPNWYTLGLARKSALFYSDIYSTHKRKEKHMHKLNNCTHLHAQYLLLLHAFIPPFAIDCTHFQRWWYFVGKCVCHWC